MTLYDGFREKKTSIRGGYIRHILTFREFLIYEMGLTGLTGVTDMKSTENFRKTELSKLYSTKVYTSSDLSEVMSASYRDG